jgi:RNA polymerase sigma-70 factor (ECF subfamily)
MKPTCCPHQRTGSIYPLALARYAAAGSREELFMELYADNPTGAPSAAAMERSGVTPATVQELVRRAQAGEAAAFGRLYRLHWRMILNYFRYHLHGHNDLAEDLAADVFLKALEKLHSYRFSGVPFSAWLYRIAHNHLVDHLRGLAKKPSAPLDGTGDINDPTAEQPLEAFLTRQQLAGVLDRLTPEQRQVVIHRFLYERTIAETARLMAKNADAVKQLQFRAVRSMRRALEAPLPASPLPA